MATHELRVGPDAWTATADRRKVEDKILMGVVLCVRRNKHIGSGTERREEWFIPFEELGNVSFGFNAIVDTIGIDASYPCDLRTKPGMKDGVQVEATEEDDSEDLESTFSVELED